jgi:hypothetical protein
MAQHPHFSLSATFEFFQSSIVVAQPVNPRKDPNVADIRNIDSDDPICVDKFTSDWKSVIEFIRSLLDHPNWETILVTAIVVQHAKYPQSFEIQSLVSSSQFPITVLPTVSDNSQNSIDQKVLRPMFTSSSPRISPPLFPNSK